MSLDSHSRAVLPIHEQAYAGPFMYDAGDPSSQFPPIDPLRPPAGAPNVIIAMIDDVGFGASTAFGGPCETPTAERLAVSDDYSQRASSFNGRVNWVQIDIAEAAEDLDHLISPDERLRIAMSRQ